MTNNSENSNNANGTLISPVARFDVPKTQVPAKPYFGGVYISVAVSGTKGTSSLYFGEDSRTKLSSVKVRFRRKKDPKTTTNFTLNFQIRKSSQTDQVQEFADKYVGLKIKGDIHDIIDAKGNPVKDGEKYSKFFQSATIANDSVGTDTIGITLCNVEGASNISGNFIFHGKNPNTSSGKPHIIVDPGISVKRKGTG